MAAVCLQLRLLCAWGLRLPVLMLCRAMQVLEKTGAATEGLRESGVDLARWFVPEGYVIQVS